MYPRKHWLIPAQYPIFGANEYFADTNRDIHSKMFSQTTHGQYPPDPLPKTGVTYFGNVTNKADIPLAPLFASMLYFTRFERVTPMIPPHLRNAICQTRAEANSLGHKGPTLEDVVEFVDHCRTRFVHTECRSAGYCQRMLRIDLDQCSPHVLGSATGRWRGSYIVWHSSLFLSGISFWILASVH